MTSSNAPQQDIYNFSKDEIRQELEKLGYCNVSDERLHEFKKDLDSLVQNMSGGSETVSEAGGASSPVLNTGGATTDDSYGADIQVMGVDPSMRRNRNTYDTYNRAAGSQPIRAPDYTTEPIRAPDYRTQPIRGQDYKTEPIRAPEYSTQPIRGQDYTTEPIRAPDYRTQPIRGQEYRTEPIRAPDYRTQPIRGEEYRTEPIRAPDYRTQPIRGEDYRTEPIRGQDYRFNDYRPSTDYYQPMSVNIKYNTAQPGYLTSPKGSRSAPSSPTKSVVSTDTDPEKKFIKRKVLRKINGESIIDESIQETDSDEVSLLRDSFHVNRDESSAPRRPLTALGIPRVDNKSNLPSVIYPMIDHPHTRNLKRCDPVNRGNQYREAWDSQRAPGEKQHKSLRWNIRENMLYHDTVVKKTQRVYVANDYVIPTEKKRKSLRWQIRSDLAAGKMPGSGYHSD
ncbi:uncharacterized protein LOC141915103 [Tubulanus polymorphus]|uniref:uncharacterized protein LOC141915103 n=1 Tax=Tubulanus polymorphus TaxID=672921 RepID=UPI003DA4EC91